MRRITQPGPAATERIQWVAAGGAAFACDLPAGLTLLDAVRRAFGERGCVSGVLTLEGGALAPFAYVIPALSSTPDHAAFYSPAFRPAGGIHLQIGAMTLGTRDGVAFFHCHALWTEADGRRGCGHVLPEESVIAAPIRIAAVGLEGAGFAAEPDPETNFKLFGPVAVAPAAEDSRFFALRLRPHQDVAHGLEQFCYERGIAAARLHGGVGSIVGAHFDDGRVVEPFATELAIVAGHIGPAAGGQLAAELDVVLIDYTGAVAEGRLVRGDNPVLITLEVVLEAIDPVREV